MSCFYDLHIHTALSPCAKDDMTPNNIVRMAQICGLDVITITDHNSTTNCAAVQKAAINTSVTVICGMELCTQEEIHTVCLFPNEQSACYFGKYVAAHSMQFKNRPDIYGNQLIFDEQDNIIGKEDNLLLTASGISIQNLPHIINHYGGVAFPAHIERSAYGILSVLGTVPEDCFFSTVEVRNTEVLNQNPIATDILKRYNVVTNSDAHTLVAINEAQYSLPADPDFKSITTYISQKR